MCLWSLAWNTKTSVKGSVNQRGGMMKVVTADGEIQTKHVKRPEYRGSEMERRGTRWERNGKGCQQKENNNNKIHLLFRWGFGLGPGTDVPRTSPSRGEKLSLRVGAREVRLGLVPHFALGPRSNVSNPTSSGGDPLVVGMNDMDGWLDIRGSELLDAWVTPSNRTPSWVTAHTAKRCQTVSNSIWNDWLWERSLTLERVPERNQFRHRAGYG